MKKALLLFLIWGFVFTASPFLRGENISEKIRLNGFLSQGYVYSTGNDFIPNSSKNGSFEMSEFGATFSVDLTEKLHVGFQIFARDFGPIGNHNIKLDWGYADYRVSDSFGIRVGKVKTPVGFFNEVRDTDALHPMAILPQSIYDESMRPVFVAYDGLGLYGNLDLKAVGDFDYHFFVGTVHHPEGAPHLLQIQVASNALLSQMGLTMTGITMDTEIFCGGRVIWNTPLPGFRLGGTYTYLKGEMNSLISHPLEGLFPLMGSMELKNSFFLSGEFSIGDLTIISEYMELLPLIKMEMFGQMQEVSSETMQGWYVMVSYMIGDKLTFTGLYDRFISNKGDTAGQSSVAQGLPDYYGWQKDLALGLRFDINFNWTFKIEWHKIDGMGKSWVFSPIPAPEQKWNMFVAKFSFNF